MIRILIIIALLGSFGLVSASNENFEKGNEFYTNELYDSASVAYEKVLTEGQYSFEVYYNLGNAYFRQNQLGKAILNWEKARKIEPTNPMVIANLNHAYAFTRDKFDLEIKSEGFIKSFIYEKTPAFWGVLSIICSIVLAATLFLFFTAKSDTIHQVSFYVSIVVFVGLVGSVVFASMHKSYIEKSEEAIVLTPRVKILVAPNEGAEESFPLHEGTKITVVSVDGEWTEIIVNKTNRGWVKQDYIGFI